MSEAKPKSFAARMLVVDAMWKDRFPSVNQSARHLFYVVASFNDPVTLRVVQRNSMLQDPTFRRCCTALKEVTATGKGPLVETFRGSFGYEHFIVLSTQGLEFLKDLENAFSETE